jgi:N-acetylneuraminic acid mutarotase
MYSPETKEWSSVATPYDAEGNEISLGGGMGTSFGEGMILCAGGVDKDIFLKALQGIYAGKEYLSHPVEWYRFNRNLLLYHPQTNKWTTLGEYEQGARAGAVIVSQDGFHYIINGELKPMKLIELKKIEDEKIDYIGRSCIGLVVCKLHKGRATHTFCYSCTIEGGIATGSVSSESGNRIVYRCVRRR